MTNTNCFQLLLIIPNIAILPVIYTIIHSITEMCYVETITTSLRKVSLIEDLYYKLYESYISFFINITFLIGINN